MCVCVQWSLTKMPVRSDVNWGAGETQEKSKKQKNLKVSSSSLEDDRHLKNEAATKNKNETTALKNYSVMRFSSVVTVVEVRGHSRDTAEAAAAADQVHLKGKRTAFLEVNRQTDRWDKQRKPRRRVKVVKQQKTHTHTLKLRPSAHRIIIIRVWLMAKKKKKIITQDTDVKNGDASLCSSRWWWWWWLHSCGQRVLELVVIKWKKRHIKTEAVFRYFLLLFLLLVRGSKVLAAAVGWCWLTRNKK